MNTSQPLARGGVTKSDLEPLLNEYEYARIIQRSLASVRRDRQQGTGCAFVKLGALVRYRPADVRKHLEQNLRSGSSNGER